MKKDKRKKEMIPEHVFVPKAINDPDYLGKHVEAVEKPKDRKKKAVHPIFLFEPIPTYEKSDDRDDAFKRLNQIVNIYEHTIYDFEFNAKKIINHYKKYYGSTSLHMFTLGQNIAFRVTKGGPVFGLSLFKFFVNYTMLITPIVMGADLTHWQPWVPGRWTDSEWESQIDKYIKDVRNLGNMRAICECLEMSKYLLNLWAAEAGDRIALSISNNDFIEVAKRSRDAFESLSCTFPIPEGISPSELEALTTKRTKELLDFITKQTDLPISVYTKNGLFNPAQFREFAVHITHKPDLFGNTIPYTYPTNTIMGTADPRAHMTDAYGGRKAEILKLNVSEAGALERSLSMMMSQIRFVDVDYECDSTHFRTTKIKSTDALGRLEGRVCTLDPKSDEYLIIDPSNTKLVGKTVYFKTPITCTHPRRKEGYICSACYGKLMASLNRDVHIGRLAAMQLADEMEQKLLSAKHALATNTQSIKFDESFDRYFDVENCRITFNDEMLDASIEETEEFNHLWLEFHPAVMKKQLDGEGRPYDRSVDEIIIFDDRDESRTIIREEGGLRLYLSPDFVVEYFLPALQFIDEKKGVVRIPFSDLIDTGNLQCEDIFEYEHPNMEIADALLTLNKIMNNSAMIDSFESYDDCLDQLLPLFAKGGIHIPDYQCEMMISCMIYNEDQSPVDWTRENPDYKFYTIDKSIQNLNSALTSVLYHETAPQIAGAYHTYEKTGTSAYDYYLLSRGDESTSTKEEDFY